MRHGQIVALYGSIGSGHAEVARVLCGDTPVDAGSIRIGDGPESASHDASRGAEIGIVPENRMDNALFPELPVRSNISVASVRKARLGRLSPLLSARREREQAGRGGPQGAGRHAGPCRVPCASSVGATSRRSCWPGG